ncbi:MAG: hypothetical protein HBSIN01_33700 [Candidatus Brocadia sinica]|nr:MAG: hypothetical protein HBSIN01_33700 [Candidatus Brocadia sinica]
MIRIEFIACGYKRGKSCTNGRCREVEEWKLLEEKIKCLFLDGV